MTYLMSDLHGRYEAYRRMLELIRFSESDELYVLGDVLDRGPQPLEILLDMRARPRVHPILGNHEHTAYPILRALTRGEHPPADAWLADGGESTLAGFVRLSPKEQRAAVDYLATFAPYAELTAGGADYLLVHAGLADFDPSRPLSAYPVADLVAGRTDYTRRYYPDRYLVTGHTPTGLIAYGHGGRIWQGNGHVALDCGNGWGGTLGCLRLEDMAEFYV